MAFITLARNVRVDTESSTHSGHISLFILHELFLLGYWQEMEKDADSGWTAASNVLAEPTDLAVAASTQYEITSPSTPFTQAMEGQYISLYASNNANRGLYQIKKVITSSRITLQPMCRVAPWVDETGISAKIHNAGKSDYLANTSYFVMRAPSATGRPLEVRVSCNSAANLIAMSAYPLGDFFDPPGVPGVYGNQTQTSSGSNTIATSAGYSYFNAYITDPAGPGLLFLCYISSPNRWSRCAAGELEDVAVGDDYPGFVNTSGSLIGEEYVDSESGATLRMLDDVNVALSCYPTWWVSGTSGNPENSPHRQQFSVRMKGKAPYWKPNVVAGNVVAGAYVRGTLPYYTCNPNHPTLFPIDPGFFHARSGIVIPRVGAQDSVLRGLA